ncbi:MAG TPA: type IV secretory system conjugative DNA transfer family protein [Verrucomicrobiae bacterium]|jgi:hypothetical protein
MSTEKELMKLSENDAFTEDDSFMGTVCIGGTGSGKTSGSGDNLRRGFLKNGYGGLVMTVKNDETRAWQNAAQQAGRSADLIIIEPGGPNTLNFLDYEAHRSGDGAGLTFNLVHLLLTAVEGGNNQSLQDAFWEKAANQLLTNAIDLVLMANDEITLPDVVEVIRSAPSSAQDAALMTMSGEKLAELAAAGQPAWRHTSKCAQLMIKAEGRTRDPERISDLRETFAYFLHELATLDSRTRSNLMMTVMAPLTALLRKPFRRLFCGKTTVTPEDSFNGKIIILHLPVKEYGEVGRTAQMLFKTVWQQTVERRGSDGVPLFHWADEAQFFVHRNDMTFQQTARSSRAATVYLTQSIVNFRAALDKGESESVSQSILGCLQNKIFHANGCPITNRYAESLFGEELQSVATANQGPAGFSAGVQRQMLPIIPATRFTRLKRGGLANNRIVEAIIFSMGHTWLGDDGKHNKNWLLANFEQAAY